VAVHTNDRGRRVAVRVESTLEPVVAAVLPGFGLVARGYLAGRFGLVTQASSLALNRFVYAFALRAASRRRATCQASRPAPSAI
jgi:hypothetical protein